MSCGKGAFCALFLTVAWSAGAAAQEPIPTADRARALYLEARFREAGEAFDAVLGRADLDVRTAADAHVHLAALRHMLGEPERARAHAEAAVALVPDVAVPEGAAAELVAIVDAAREELGGTPARLRIDAEVDGRSRRVRARLDPAPGALGLSLALRCGAAASRATPPEVEVVVRADRAVRCEATAHTPGGAMLFGVRREMAPAAAFAPDAAGDDGASPWPWIGLAAGVAVAAGIAIAVVATSSSGNGPVISATEIDADGW